MDLLAEVGINFHSDVANLNTRAEFEQKTIEDRIDQLAKYINGSLRDKLIETDPTLKALGLAIQKSASYQADWE